MYLPIVWCCHALYREIVDVTKTDNKYEEDSKIKIEWMTHTVRYRQREEGAGSLFK